MVLKKNDNNAWMTRFEQQKALTGLNSFTLLWYGPK